MKSFHCEVWLFQYTIPDVRNCHRRGKVSTRINGIFFREEIPPECYPQNVIDRTAKKPLALEKKYIGIYMKKNVIELMEDLWDSLCYCEGLLMVLISAATVVFNQRKRGKKNEVDMRKIIFYQEFQSTGRALGNYI